MSFTITEPLVRKLLATVDVGLVKGLGSPEPGKMCVEAAVSFALGEEHSDGPSCVDLVVRAGKIALNDSAWSSNMARARGMRKVAIAQLGSRDTIDHLKYVRLLAQYTLAEIVPLAAEDTISSVEYAASSGMYAQHATKFAGLAKSIDYAVASAETAAFAADAAAEFVARYADTLDVALRLSAELMVRALQECGSPGCDWLWLCDEENP